MLRNGSIPQRVLKRFKDGKIQFFSTDDLAAFSTSKANRSRIARTLRDEGKAEALGKGRFRLLDGKPRVVLNRAWSAPGVEQSSEKIIFMTLGRPTFLDVARICKSFGVERVRGALDELVQLGDVSVEKAKKWHGRLDNIEEGFQDAASQYSAAGHRTTQLIKNRVPVGQAAVVQLEVNGANAAVSAAAYRDSGMFVSVADVDRPVWQFRTDQEKVLRRWDEILRQAKEGRLAQVGA